ncbi:MAG TPA: TrkA family potassium uptake protein [Anaerolineales bacterium]|nr:TrkA family potassium uptake protein [Anaerolineales bacterium]
MLVIIVGGGKVGSHLALLLLNEGHEVKLIDDRPDVLERLREELPQGAVIAGDGSSPSVLEAAGIDRANVLAAVTAEDEANLVITSLGRFEFNVPRVIARVNNPKNAWMFNADMGVDVALNQADILAKLIAEEMSLGDMMTLLKLRRGEYVLVEEKLPPGSQMLDAPLMKLPLPETCVIAAVIRRGKVLVPRGHMRFEMGDEVLAVVDNASLPALRRLFAPA